ncbi:MAG: beta-ketoacyl-[acyl-carrier-protein] synthase II [Phycisphaerales bacterium]|nr:beta-ketoacyl-[acyl-carrier-protein] synthase II [Phycisphaerales bacterium]
MERRRVVVTGLGAVTVSGLDVPTTWDSLVQGRSHIAHITAFEQSADWGVTFAGECRGFEPTSVMEARDVKRMDRNCHLGMAAAAEAARDSGIDFKNGDCWRRGVAIGTGIGGIETIEHGYKRLLEVGPRKVNPFTVPKLMANSCAGNVSIMLQLRGPSLCTATACASGAHSIGTSFHIIERGDADVMVAGGTEAAVSPLCIAAFNSMKALSTRNSDPTRASRPFDKDRDGFVLSEGAGVVVLEELEHAKRRGARIYGEVVGFGSSGDAFHIAAPDSIGAGAQHSMAAALHDAGVNCDQVGYINAHGTSTPLGDAAEVAAVKAVFGEHAHKLAMSSTKSVTGHMLGAAGGLETVATVLAVCQGVLPPTINLDNPDTGFDLNFVAHQAQQRRVDIALNNSFGFGGHNTTLVIARFKD